MVPTALASNPLLTWGYDDVFPDELYVLSHPNGKYGCYCHECIHGLAAFSTENRAILFSEFIDYSGLLAIKQSFDEAREVAKSRPLPVVSLMLLDKMDDPKIHFIR